jgi:hypothetical protein
MGTQEGGDVTIDDELASLIESGSGYAREVADLYEQVEVVNSAMLPGEPTIISSTTAN